MSNAQVYCTLNNNTATVTASGDTFMQNKQTSLTDSTGKYTFTVVGTDLLSPSGLNYIIEEPHRTYRINPLSSNGSSQQTTASNVIAT